MSQRTGYPKSKRLIWKRILTYKAGLVFFGFVILVLIIAVLYGFKTGSFEFLLNVLIGVGFLIVILALVLYLPLYIINRVALKKNNFTVTDHGINIEDSSLSSYKVFVPFSSVQSVALWQEHWDKVFKIYNIVILTPSLGGQYILRGFDESVANALRNRIVELSRPVTPNEILKQASDTAQAQKLIVKRKETEQPVSSKEFPIDGKAVVFDIFSALAYALKAYLLTWLVLFVVFTINEVMFKASLNQPVVVGLQGIVALLAFIWKLKEINIAKKNYSFELNAFDMTIRSGIYSVNEEKVPYKIMQEVTVSQDFFQHILKLSSVLIKTAAINETPAGDILVNGWVVIPGLKKDHAQIVFGELKRIVGN